MLGGKPRFDHRSAAPVRLVALPPLVDEVTRVATMTARVALRGELDMASAPQARLVLKAASSIGCREIELFGDAAGLRVFVDAQQDCAERGGLLLLVDPSPAASRVLELASLERLLADWRT